MFCFSVKWCHVGWVSNKLRIVRGVSRRSQTGGLNESLNLAPWSKQAGSKVEEWRPHPTPTATPPVVNLAPLKFSSLEPLRGVPP